MRFLDERLVLGSIDLLYLDLRRPLGSLPAEGEVRWDDERFALLLERVLLLRS